MEGGGIHSVRVTTVGPGKQTGLNAEFDPGNMGLAMKLHYLRGVYYFRSEAFEGLTTLNVKEPLFSWLNQFPMPCGRFRRSPSGRPFIKCNDCGVRFIHAKCDHTLDHWLHIKDSPLEALLCQNHVLGPQLPYSPLLYLQMTVFKCGGVAMGLSWAHVVGDAFSAAKFMNMLGRVISGFKPERPIDLTQTQNELRILDCTPNITEDPVSVRRVDPVGDSWVYATPCKMETFFFNVSPAKLSHLRSKLAKHGVDSPSFESLAAAIWQCIARIRADSRVVNIFRKGHEASSNNSILGNNQIVSVVRAAFAVAEANPSELAWMLKNEALDETRIIQQAVERDGGSSDFIVYGVNLSFVNLEEATFYDFECRRGQKPISVSCKIDSVGEKGVVLVMGDGDKSGGRLVTVTLAENEVVGVKSELKREGLMA